MVTNSRCISMNICRECYDAIGFEVEVFSIPPSVDAPCGVCAKAVGRDGYAMARGAYDWAMSKKRLDEMAREAERRMGPEMTARLAEIFEQSVRGDPSGRPIGILPKKQE